MSLTLAAGAQPIAGYCLVRLLGRGGFGEVWEALAPGGVQVALKFVRLETIEAGVEQRALEVVRNIRHPHLLDVQFATVVDDCLVIAMPLCDESLMDRLRACLAREMPGLPRAELLGYMEELARAIDFLNEPRHRTAEGSFVGVQHRDVKPHNIFLVGGSARLADFGLAKVLEATSASHTGAMSPSYVAPELLDGHVSNRSDQYSLAVTYVQLRTGRLPFAGQTVNQILFAHMSKEPDLSGLPEQERRVLARALAKQPEERWPSCAAFVLSLVTAAQAEDDSLTTESDTLLPEPAAVRMPVTRLPDTEPMTEAPPARPDRFEGRRSWRRVGLLSLALGVLVLSGLVLIRRLAPPGKNAADPAAAAEVALLEAAENAPARPRIEVKPPAPEPPAAVPVLEQPKVVEPSPPEPPRLPRTVRTERDVLGLIRDHLRQARPSDRVFLRYLTLHNLHNNQRVGDAELRLARAAVAKLVNSLSWESEIVLPRSIDGEQVVLALDIRDLGWDRRDLWSEVLKRYPYGLKHDHDRDAEVRSVAEQVYALAGTPLPYVRADWFVASGSRPPLYYLFLDLPASALVLEQQLKVDVAADFRHDRLVRAGFAGSGESTRNRLVERHPALYGACWVSYDFGTNEGTGDLFQYPLGPVFADNPYRAHAFEHAGSELLFNLPNGLQGYLLTDGRGARLGAGPIEVVSDALKTAGTTITVPGLSCMGCHRLGVVAVHDMVRDGLAVAGNARDKAERLYPAREVMDALLARDESRFLKALELATASFLKVGQDQNKGIRDFPEPIGAIARGYFEDLSPDALAAELGLSDAKNLAMVIQANRRLRESVLAPLLEGATIKRADWDSLGDRFLSRFQEAARDLELGTPFRSF